MQLLLSATAVIISTVIPQYNTATHKDIVISQSHKAPFYLYPLIVETLPAL